MKKTIYFICTGNSCRSQMAEGFGKKLLGSDWEVYSAGIETHGVNPKAIEAMKEVDIDISNQTSDLIDPAIINKSHLVVTLCSDADSKCPVLPPHVTKEHWGFDDPAGKDWSEFQRVRDEIGQAIKNFKLR
ncbi:arsenate reductase (thioredoxin) [Listeria fleischmannii]|uniref:Arsenate reductase n=2 Tax=Listeria fleischmannii TaxID=1069827 RepID=W7DVK5_9LIST|nr:arsenate reductase (thioredoxin) [Listeria fleischmannii]EIA21158.1 arsenate reductase [Listeria fleischmannii subsp. coloradonensis]EUJ51867.1 arsenate reductase [Listeria fleischmannii FSL S10-1203]MBC1397891.1 arsenate reductase (thioredoxin) [Listeria fleischmannii]MBC1417452.1 arsenate reductase (thioredoxin) [Listeria fleischmannii]MBC1427344.1 arsenate reductase (thioredoxin) [Listeria fleischmannii]